MLDPGPSAHQPKGPIFSAEGGRSLPRCSGEWAGGRVGTLPPSCTVLPSMLRTGSKPRSRLQYGPAFCLVANARRRRAGLDVRLSVTLGAKPCAQARRPPPTRPAADPPSARLSLAAPCPSQHGVDPLTRPIVKTLPELYTLLTMALPSARYPFASRALTLVTDDAKGSPA